MTQRVEITVKTCEQCPFYERGVLSAIADALAKDNRKTGTCKHAAGGRAFPFGRVHIDNPEIPPMTCPLRAGDTIVRIDA